MEDDLVTVIARNCGADPAAVRQKIAAHARMRAASLAPFMSPNFDTDELEQIDEVARRMDVDPMELRKAVGRVKLGVTAATMNRSSAAPTSRTAPARRSGVVVIGPNVPLFR